jgi:hypothetical protein
VVYPRLVIGVCTLTSAFVLAVTPVSAQRVSLSPTIGVYIPTSELVKAANGEEFKQEIALAVGGRLGFYFGPRFGILTSVSYVPSNLRFTLDQNETKTDANLLFGTTRATYLVIPYTSPVWLGINAGASLVKRGGKAYEEETDKTDIGGVVGTTLGFRLGSFLSFYVAAEDYIYGRTFVDASSGTLDEKKTQNDVQLAVGFGIPLSR